MIVDLLPTGNVSMRIRLLGLYKSVVIQSFDLPRKVNGSELVNTVRLFIMIDYIGTSDW